MSYFVAVILQYITMVCHYTFLACAATFGGGLFFVVLSFSKDVQNDLETINENAKTQANRFKTLKQISDVVQYHSTFKR